MKKMMKKRRRRRKRKKAKVRSFRRKPQLSISSRYPIPLKPLVMCASLNVLPKQSTKMEKSSFMEFKNILAKVFTIYRLKQ